MSRSSLPTALQGMWIRISGHESRWIGKDKVTERLKLRNLDSILLSNEFLRKFESDTGFTLYTFHSRMCKKTASNETNKQTKKPGRSNQLSSKEESFSKTWDRREAWSLWKWSNDVIN